MHIDSKSRKSPFPPTDFRYFLVYLFMQLDCLIYHTGQDNHFRH